MTSTMPSMLTSTAGSAYRSILSGALPLLSRPSRFLRMRQKWTEGEARCKEDAAKTGTESEEGRSPELWFRASGWKAEQGLGWGLKEDLGREGKRFPAFLSV